MANLGSYSEGYREKCFQRWYLEGKPGMGRLRGLIEPADDGNVPDHTVLMKWREQGSWEARADELDAKLQEKIDSGLIDMRLKMFEEHAERALELQMNGMQYLKEHGFDSSASAVQAVIKGADLERDSRGLAENFSRVVRMDNKQLQNRLRELLERTKAVAALPAEIIEDTDTDIEEVQEESDDT